jgi:nitrate reductase NapE
LICINQRTGFWVLSSRPLIGAAAMNQIQTERRHERLAFLFLSVLLAPILAVAVVAGWGFVVWAFQLIAGPPGAQL